MLSLNNANPYPKIGTGVDIGIHATAGPSLLASRKEIGDINPGESAITPGFNLHARYAIHTVGPVRIDGAHNEVQALYAQQFLWAETAIR